MRKRQIGYGIFLAAQLILLLIFGKVFFLYLFLMLLILAVLVYFILRAEVGRIQMNLKFKSSVRRGKKLRLIVKTDTGRMLLAAQSVLLECEIRHTMFERTEEKCYQLCLKRSQDRFEIPIDTKLCGETRIQCKRVMIQDLLGLYRIPVELLPEQRAIVYPKEAGIQTELSRQTIGSAREEGFMQNRKGNDASEMFELREYIPGDDIRSIHWKLSSKTEDLVLREASDPAHYNVILLIDYGMRRGETAVSDEELNAAIAFAATIGEQLLKFRMNFCMAVPTETGLKISAVRNEREYRQMVADWLSRKIPQESGTALNFFRAEHLEQKFTKLILVSAGEYRPSMNGLDQKISITVVNAVQGKEVTHINMSNTYEVVDLPAKRVKGKLCRILF